MQPVMWLWLVATSKKGFSVTHCYKSLFSLLFRFEEQINKLKLSRILLYFWVHFPFTSCFISTIASLNLYSTTSLLLSPPSLQNGPPSPSVRAMASSSNQDVCWFPPMLTTLSAKSASDSSARPLLMPSASIVTLMGRPGVSGRRCRAQRA